MRTLRVAGFVSLDAVMQAPGGEDEERDDGFRHGGWQQPSFDEVAGERVGASMAQTGAFLLGRKLAESVTTSTGVVMATYVPER